jgi:hypothetical protein
MKPKRYFTFLIRQKTTSLMLAALVAVLLLALAGCRLPGSPAPTPFVFTTPDKTLTAIFAPLLTLTPEAPQAFTATPVIVHSSPTPSATFFPTVVATNNPAPSPTRPAPTLRSGSLVEAAYLENPPVLDGILDEWSLPSYPVRSVVYGAGEWQGEADCSATVMVGWDTTYLYVAVQVRDDRYVQDASGVNLFKGDSLEILLDVDLEGDFDVKSLNTDDYQLGISPGSPYPGNDSAGRSPARFRARCGTIPAWYRYHAYPYKLRSYPGNYAARMDRPDRWKKQTGRSSYREAQRCPAFLRRLP